MILENRNYVPTLAVRASEMNGLEFLPATTKDGILPCFLLAPWANSRTLERTIDRIQRAYANRHYFLDIDRNYELTNIESGPQQELAHLLDPAGAFRNWVDFVREHEWVWPCIQSRGLEEMEIREQIEAFQVMERPYCIRIVRDRFPANIEELVGALAAGGTADYAVILEGGWTRDPLFLAIWFNDVIAECLQRIDADVPTIISSTSIPKLFTEFSGITPISFSSRQLVEQVDRQSNRTRIIYGDWGSTRPRDFSGYANRPWDRIDYPTENTWYIARNRDDNWDFLRAARELVVESGVWDGGLGVWGEEMIYQTTISASLGINTPQKNVAARVNIHLHRQTFFGIQRPRPEEFDENWQD